MKLRTIAILAALGVTAGAARAAPRDPLEGMLASRDALQAALAPSVTVGPIAWSDDACRTRFAAASAVAITVTGAERDALAACVAALGLARARRETGSPVAAIGRTGAVVALRLRAGKITALDAAAPDPRDARFPTVLRLWVNRDLVPSEATRAAIARRPNHAAEATLKVCHDDHGTVVSRRIIHPSGVPAFDREALAYFETVEQLEPYQPGGKPAAACSILTLRYPDVLGGAAVNRP